MTIIIPKKTESSEYNFIFRYLETATYNVVIYWYHLSAKQFAELIKSIKKILT